MKFPYIILLALLVSSCRKQAHIEFTGIVPGVKNGVFIVKTLADSTVFGENIKDGKFSVAKKYLAHAGYYKMNITDADNNDDHSPFEVYLDNGKYTIETEAGKLYKYPKITSGSENQQQLSAFYTLADKMTTELPQQIKDINAELTSKYGSLSPGTYNILLHKLQDDQAKLRDINAVAFKQFLKQYPQSTISAHLMAKFDYEGDAATYYPIYQTLAPAAQNSDEGKEIGERLSRAINLLPGKKAPFIAGKLPDGKAFDPKSIDKKIIVLDFWRSSNEISRINHDQIKSLLAQDVVQKNVAFISVSLDSKPDWWAAALKDDKLTWTQVADLKGNDSPNAAGYNITEIPTYYLLDGQWHVIARDVPIKGIDLEIAQYLKNHP